MIKRFTICLAFVQALFLIPATAGLSASAAQECDQNCALQLVRAGDVLPLGKLLIESGVSTRGEILQANLFERSGKWFYGFRLLNKADNNVFAVFIDAATGSVVPFPR